MEAIEFKGKIEKGSIQLPKNLEGYENHEVKVILLINSLSNKTKDQTLIEQISFLNKFQVFLEKKHPGSKASEEMNELLNKFIKALTFNPEGTNEIIDQKDKLRKVFHKMESVNMFSNISDPIMWQKQLRDEWE